MAGRPPLPVGGHGKIVVVDVTADGEKSRTWEARTYYRDADGRTRRVKRTGRTKTAAQNALQVALAERRHTAGAQLTGESRVREAAALWFEQRQAEQDAGDLAPNTLRLYRSAWRLHVEPAFGELRLREATVARCEAWQRAFRKGRSASSVRTARAVLSGVLGYAARMDAIPTNPTRDLSSIPGGRTGKAPRALTADERARWLDAMTDSAKARRWALPDLTRFMLATGARIGEALAVTWDEVDLDAGTVALRWHLVRIAGEGLVRVPGTKSDAGSRTVRIPSWAVAMLMRRRTDPGSGWPVFPDRFGGWRDPSNVLRVLREERDAAGFEWVTSHIFRKTCLTVLDEAGLSARAVADVAGHADPSMTLRVYMGRGIASDEAAAALEDLV